MSAKYHQNKNNSNKRKFDDTQQNFSSLLMYKSQAISKFCKENSMDYFEYDKIFNSKYNEKIGIVFLLGLFISL